MRPLRSFWTPLTEAGGNVEPPAFLATVPQAAKTRFVPRSFLGNRFTGNRFTCSNKKLQGGL